MSVQLAIANITLDTATVSRQGFGTVLFLGKHNFFQERVREYTSVTSMVEDGIPTSASIYTAAQVAFSQNPSPTSIKIGRQLTTSVFTPKTPATGLIYDITLEGKDAVKTTFSYVALAGDDEEAVVDALKTAIDADAGLSAVITTTKVGTVGDATLELSQTNPSEDWFVPSDLLNLVESFEAVSVETAADSINAVVLEDNDFYYFTAEDKSLAFVTAAAADIEARLKFYRFTTADVGSYLSTPTGPITIPVTNSYFRAYGEYHHEAETKFPEVAALAEIASYSTGSVTYVSRQVASVSESLNEDGRPLTTTQQSNIEGVNGGYYTRSGDFDDDPIVTVGGQVGAGEWIDNIVGRDNLQVDIQADFTNLLIRQKSKKIAFNNKGANQLRGVLKSVLNNYADTEGHNFIEDDFEIIIPDQANFNAADKAARKFTQITFKANLTNAIHMVTITGTLSL